MTNQTESTPDHLARYDEPGPSDAPLGDIFARLFESGREYADAEIDKQSLRVTLLAAGVRDIALLAAVALVLLFGTLVALMIGLVIALTPLVTALGATLIVTLAALLIVGLLVLVIKRRATRLFGPGNGQ